MPRRLTAYHQALDLCRQSPTVDIITLLGGADLPSAALHQTLRHLPTDDLQTTLTRLVRDGLLVATVADREPARYALTSKGRKVAYHMRIFLDAVATWRRSTDTN